MNAHLASTTRAAAAAKALAGSAFALALVLALAGCGDDTSSDGTSPAVTSCTPGTALCECIQGGCPSGPNLACIEDVCVYSECELGDLGCVCDADGACGTDTYGNQLRCDSGLCVHEDCPAGELGCECGADTACAEGLACQRYDALDICAPPSCEELGGEGCPCNADRSCDTGLACVLGECIELGECVAGAVDCPCRRDGGCDAGNTCNTATDYCEAIGCTPGSVGCTCADGDCTGDDLVCTDGLCEVDDCPAGDEGCECIGARCGLNDLGESLVCADGRCESDDCTPGAAGCVCSYGLDCDAGATCENGFCLADGCIDGDEGCACANGLCATGLSCRAGAICVDATGRSGGVCNSNSTCDGASRCADGLCVPCFLGTVGCGCDASDECVGDAECVGGTCVAVSDLVARIPDDPVCYYPCTSGYYHEGSWRSCPASGLMPFCVGNTECVEGSCVALGDGPRTCSRDGDCPDYQACMEGQCYSNCEGDADCGAGTACYRHVCRLPCTSGAGDCSGDTYCHLVDELNGYCLPQALAGEGGYDEIEGGLVVEPESLEFTSSNTEIVFEIYNDSPTFASVTVRKLQHMMFFDTGESEDLQDFDDGVDCTVGVDCPLYWLEIGEVGEDGTFADSFELIVDPGTSARVFVRGAGGSSAVSWRGALEILAPGLASTQVPMSYTETPDGHWSGRAVYLSQFDDTDLDAWAADSASRNDPRAQDEVNNAFIQRWGAFRSGRLSWDEMQAVMLATRTEAWRSASELDECERAACYLYTGDPSGLGEYSSDLSDVPVPTGVTELPFAMNLRVDESSDPDYLTGRIDSMNTLHYAGNPAVELRFEETGDGSDCNAEYFGACLRYVESFGATIHVGGRYRPDAGASACNARGDDSYVMYQTPWLLPDFQEDTEEVASMLVRRECRDSYLPYDAGAAADPDLAEALNLSLATSNPIPDGRTRRRVLRLLDGVLVNNSTMVILFAETMDSFFDPEDTQGIRAYGYIVVEKQPTDLSDADEDGNLIPDVYEGEAVMDERDDPDDVLGVSCSADLLAELGLTPGDLDASTAADVISKLIAGVSVTVSSDALDSSSVEQVHYFCEDTGLFDGGPDNTTAHGVELASNDNSCSADIAGICQDGGPGAAVVSNECEGDEDATTDPSCLVLRSECDLGTDLDDCGVRYEDDEDTRVLCPAGSEVVFFTVDSSIMTQQDIADEPCQLDGSCQDTLNAWLGSPNPVIQYRPVYECEGGGYYCDLNRADLRDGKLFYPAGGGEAVLPSFRAELDGAFRYRTRFANRDGDSIGFTPDICIPNSDAIPYCYDPDQIEGLRDRVDCLLSIWSSDLYEELEDAGGPTNNGQLDALDSFLAFDFSNETACLDGTTTCDCLTDPYACRTFHGFERLYAELLIMLGDESYTEAFATRFDLAGSDERSFRGSRFETDGVDLTGAAGAEMYNLYQAVQYYQEALDRFYSVSPIIWLSVTEAIEDRIDGDEVFHRVSFVTPEMVTTYMERLLRASTQKARAYSEIAERYQALNRPDLATRVIERAYTATYLESAVLSRLMQRIRDSFFDADRPQIEAVIDNGQLRYNMAMLDMRNVASSITDNTTIFGLDPDYIPFPTLNPGAVAANNGFEKLLEEAWERVRFARTREETAIASNRNYETDAAQFQAELLRIENNYEAQLGDLCGTFVADDGLVYPAIREYAPLADFTSVIADPCGLVGNGSLYQAMVAIDQIGLQFRDVDIRYANLFESIAIERRRARAQCDLIEGQADYVLCLQIGDEDACDNVPEDADLPECPEDTFNDVFSVLGDLAAGFVDRRSIPDFTPGDSECSVLSLEDEIAEARSNQMIAQGVYSTLSTMAQLTKCSLILGTSSGGDCPTALLGMELVAAASIANQAAQVEGQRAIAANEREIRLINAMIGQYQSETQCAALEVDATASMQQRMLELSQLDLEVLRLQYELDLALAQIERLRNEALRLQNEQEEVEQMTIDIEAARNDPNIRLYRNDAIINADIAFEDARRHVYRATRLYEYYTSSTYAERDQLFLIRMVGAGTYNLENYLLDLENAYINFEETYAEPDRRVEILSLRDDLMRIPYTDENDVPLGQDERISMMRERLMDPSLLDSNGYLRIPFSTNVGQLSPLTRVHKIREVEVDFIIGTYGDEVARIYLRQLGTGRIHAIDGSDLFYRFPERLGVVDVMFGGEQFFDPDVYDSWQFLDRPFANTAWELIINQRDESVNQDLDLQSLTDIRIYLHYGDFTPPEYP